MKPLSPPEAPYGPRTALARPAKLRPPSTTTTRCSTRQLHAAGPPRGRRDQGDEEEDDEDAERTAVLQTIMNHQDPRSRMKGFNESAVQAPVLPGHVDNARDHARV